MMVAEDASMLLFWLLLACDEDAAVSITLDPPVERVDADQDGYPSVATGGNDCDDVDAAVHPGASDTTCDGVDNDCYRGDGPDADGDLSTVCGGDCDDDDPRRSPLEPELCDQRDQDCDDAVDEGFDGDGDGVPACPPLTGPVVTVIGDEPGSLQFGEILAMDLDGGGDELLLAELPYLVPPRVRVFHSSPGSLLAQQQAAAVGEMPISRMRRAPDLDGDGQPEVFLIGEGYTDAWWESLSAWGGTEDGGLEAVWSWDIPAAHLSAATLADGSALVLAQGYDEGTVARVDATGISAATPIDVDPGLMLDLWPLNDSVLFGTPGAYADPLLVLRSGATWETTQTWPARDRGFLVDVATGADLDHDGADDFAWVAETVSGIDGRVFVALGGSLAPEVQEIEVSTLNISAWPVLIGGPDPLVVILEHNFAQIRPGVDRELVQRVLRAWRVRAGQAPELVQQVALDTLVFGFEVWMTVGDLDGDGWAELIVSDGGTADKDGEFPGRLRVWSTFHDCDDTDPTVQRGCD